MPVPVIVLAPAVDPPVDTTSLELTLRPTDATPENIILYPRPVPSAVAGLVAITLTAMGVSDSWPTFNQVTQGVEWYQDGVKYVGKLGAGVAVFPTPPDVRTGVAYGPNGSDYTGTYSPPAVGGGMSRGRVANA